MINTKLVLTKCLKKAYDDSYGFDEGVNLLSVLYFGRNNIDYVMKSLTGLKKILENHNIMDSDEEIYTKLTKYIDKEYFHIFMERNSININLKPNYIIESIKQVFDNKEIMKKLSKFKRNILVDFSSPNIAKDMHVGHLRSTIIGDSICKLYELQGHNVYRVNHIGDFGLQFGMIIEHLLEKYPDYTNCNLTIENLQQFYAESKKRFDLDEEFKKNAYHKVVLLQSGDKKIVDAWNFIKHISRQAYNQIYERLDVKLDEVGESFYQDKIPALINELMLKNILQDDAGRKIIKVPGHDLPLTVIKSDGGFTYDTTDLAAIRYRLVDLHVDDVIYVVDNGQEEHFKLIFKVAEMMQWLKPEQSVKHVGFGLVLGDDKKKFKSRSGDTVKLVQLLDEGLVKAKEMLEAKRGSGNDLDKNKIIQNVAYGCIKYADLSSIRTNNYVFSFNKMLSLKGNTGAYQLYEYVRICAIFRNTNVIFDDLMKYLPDINLNEKEEMVLCKTILIFPEIIETLNNNLMFHILCSYLYDLTNTFSVFHTKCRCLEFDKDKNLIDINYDRLLLCMATKIIIEHCFEILGIKKLERM